MEERPQDGYGSWGRAVQLDAAARDDQGAAERPEDRLPGRIGSVRVRRPRQYDERRVRDMESRRPRRPSNHRAHQARRIGVEPKLTVSPPTEYGAGRRTAPP